MKTLGRTWGKNKLTHYLKLILVFITIWLPLVFIIVLDLLMEIYQHIAFPFYGIKPIKRSEYIVIDRNKLRYLKFAERINCVYCGYVNGVFPYWAAIAQETELYWCGIKHRKTPKVLPVHYDEYAEFDDPDSFAQKFPR